MKSILAVMFSLMMSTIALGDDLAKVVAVQQAQIARLEALVKDHQTQLETLKGRLDSQEKVNRDQQGQLDSQSGKVSTLENSTQSIAAKSCSRNAVSDFGYPDDYRGLYNVDGCIVFCRWAGNNGSGGDPTQKVTSGSSFWSCADGQEYRQFSSFRYMRVSKI